MIAMDCEEVRLSLLDHQRGRLSPEADAGILAHLEGCAACREADAVERALTDVLEQRLPQRPASLALKRRLAAQWPAAGEGRSRGAGWRRRWWLPAVGLALVLLVGAWALHEQTSRRAAPVSAMVSEAVNDHLRGLDGRRPVEVVSSEMHQVKPWFAGRLDFAPVVAFAGDDQFPLRGAAVEYFLDRKAAVFLYNRRLHTISLLVFRADNLPWPTSAPSGLYTSTARGFNVTLWRQGELGYAIVSDLDASELRQLALRLAGPP